MVIVDTSVWIAHLRDGHEGLMEALDAGKVASHPFVIGELACGRLGDRATIISLLQLLPTAQVAQDDEVLALIDARALVGKGLGYIDVHLLASALLSGTPVWTLDKRLATVATELRCGYES